MGGGEGGRAPAKVHRGSPLFTLVCILCSKDLCLVWLPIVSWSFTLTCLFWSFEGNVPSFQTSIGQGSSCTDSSTDGHGTCGRKIRLKCAGCNQCERMSEVKGKVKQLSWEVGARGDGGEMASILAQTLERHTASPTTRWSQVKIKTSYCCLSVSLDSVVH